MAKFVSKNNLGEYHKKIKPLIDAKVDKDVDNLTNYTLSTGVGAKLGLSIDTSTYVMTIALKNSSGTTLDTQTVDLPLETMVVDASYNKSTKEITLTLQNGTTTSFSVADLVSGLATQSALNTTNTNVANLTTKVSTAESNITKITNNTTKIADASGGFMGGTGAYSTFGAGAVGKGAAATGDAELGAYGGGAIGAGATSRHGAGAVGYYAKASQGGFAGGYNAVAITDTYDSQGNMMGSIQLGEGTNDTPLSLQVYGDNIYNAQTHQLTVQDISLNGKAVALKDEGVFFVEGLTTTAEGTWAGTNSRITSYYDGLTINFKIGVAGASGGTTLNINGLGAKTCYLRGTTKITTHYAVGTMVILSYNATTGAFYSGDYDANSNVKQSPKTTNGNFPILLRGTSAGTSETTTSTSFSTKVLVNPSTGNLTATTFTENGTTLANKYLGKTAKASDSDKLDGKDSSYYVNTDDTAYKFAQEEYNKSLNEFNINSLISSTSNACTSTISNGAINTVATGNYAYKLYYMSGLEIGETYSISFKGIKVGSSESQVFIGNAINVDSTAYARKWLGTSSSTFTITFTATTDILSITTYVAFGDYVNGANLTISEIMLNKGNLPLPYQPYNGEIVHKGDITPIKIWENANINSSFASQVVTMSQNFDDAKGFIVVYENYQYQTLLPEYKFIKYTVGVNTDCFITGSRVESNTNILLTRRMYLSGFNKIGFDNAYYNNSANNAFLIPLAVFKIV